MPLCKVTANLTGIFHLHLSLYYVIIFFLAEIVSLVGNLGLQYTYTIKVFFIIQDLNQFVLSTILH